MEVDLALIAVAKGLLDKLDIIEQLFKDLGEGLIRVIKLYPLEWDYSSINLVLCIYYIGVKMSIKEVINIILNLIGANIIYIEDGYPIWEDIKEDGIILIFMNIKLNIELDKVLYLIK